MNKYKVKSCILALIIIVAALFCLSSCTDSSDKANENPEGNLMTNSQSPTVRPTNTPNDVHTDIIIDSCYLGRYTNGQWSSFLGNDTLHVKKGLLVDLNDLKTHKEYIGYGEGEKLGSIIGFLEEEHNMSFKFDREDVMLALNSDFNPLPVRPCLNSDIAQSDINIVQGFLEGQGIHDKVSISQIIEVDIDNDSKNERIIIANTERDENFSTANLTPQYIKTRTGVYAVVLLVKEQANKDIVIPVFTEIRNANDLLAEENSWIADSFIEVNAFGIYDLNADNCYEIVLKFWDWDRPQIIVYEFKDNKVFPVLYGDLSW